jgi:hypothetical protein
MHIKRSCERPAPRTLRSRRFNEKRRGRSCGPRARECGLDLTRPAVLMLGGLPFRQPWSGSHVGFPQKPDRPLDRAQLLLPVIAALLSRTGLALQRRSGHPTRTSKALLTISRMADRRNGSADGPAADGSLSEKSSQADQPPSLSS